MWSGHRFTPGFVMASAARSHARMCRRPIESVDEQSVTKGYLSQALSVLPKFGVYWVAMPTAAASSPR
jgi:hypothetical protein